MSEKNVSRRGFIKKGTLGVAASALIPSFLSSGSAFAAQKGDKTTPMFCYQCEQTFKGKGCTHKGICGKKPEIAALQDLLVHALKGLSVAADAGRRVGVTDAKTDRFVCMALFATLTNVDFDPDRFEDLLVESVELRESMIKRER